MKSLKGIALRSWKSLKTYRYSSEVMEELIALRGLHISLRTGKI